MTHEELESLISMAQRATPGPWKAKGAEICATDVHGIEVGRASQVLSVGEGGSYCISVKEQKANAELMAAAPELLNALKKKTQAEKKEGTGPVCWFFFCPHHSHSEGLYHSSRCGKESCQMKDKRLFANIVKEVASPPQGTLGDIELQCPSCGALMTFEQALFYREEVCPGCNKEQIANFYVTGFQVSK